MLKHCQGIDDGDGAFNAVVQNQCSRSAGQRVEKRSPEAPSADGSFPDLLQGDPKRPPGVGCPLVLALMGPELCFPHTLFFPILRGRLCTGESGGA